MGAVHRAIPHKLAVTPWARCFGFVLAMPRTIGLRKSSDATRVPVKGFAHIGERPTSHDRGVVVRDLIEQADNVAARDAVDRCLAELRGGQLLECSQPLLRCSQLATVCRLAVLSRITPPAEPFFTNRFERVGCSNLLPLLILQRIFTPVDASAKRLASQPENSRLGTLRHLALLLRRLRVTRQAGSIAGVCYLIRPRAVARLHPVRTDKAALAAPGRVRWRDQGHA
jgi:hypothetical protein